MVHASRAVVARAMKGMMVWAMEPIIAFRINWTSRIQMVCAGLFLVISFCVRVVGGHGFEPSIYPRMSYLMKRV